MAQGSFPSFYRYIGPSPSGGYYYNDPTTNQILDLPAAPTPEQQQAYEATKPGYGTIAQTQAVSIDQGETQTLGGVATPSPNTTDDSPAKAPTSPGVGARTDDAAPTSTGDTQTSVNAAFNNAKITPRPNVLNKYASYSYALSWYLLSPEQFTLLQATGKKNIANWQLLMQSAGAPQSTAGNSLDAQPNAQVTGSANSAGRNQEFSLDYYMDNLDIETLVPLKGTGMAHSAVAMSFTVVEPNGITLIGNLYRAVDNLYKELNITDRVNYPMAQYCLAIRFYGYDQNGNLATAAGSANQGDPSAIVEKFYPFIIENITYRLANRAVEYTVRCKPIAQFYNLSQDRGTIPFNYELVGQTVGDILNGKTVGQSPEARSTDGRQPSASFEGPPDPGYATNNTGEGIY